MIRCISYLLGLWLIMAAAAAQEAPPRGISVELNTVEAQDNSCTLTFVVTNGHAADIDKLIYETVLFDRSGQVNRLTLFDFGNLPPGSPRVRQFAVPDLPCDGLSRILFNGLNTCQSAELSVEDCRKGLTSQSRTDIEVLN